MGILTKDEYYMSIARAVRGRANCLGSKVGAVIVVEDRIVSTGYNGTPDSMSNCIDGGCPRCSHRYKKYPHGTGYDVCYCVHAEQNAILSAARHGISVHNATIYSTLEPCIGCLKELHQIHAEAVVFERPFEYSDLAQRAAYETLKKTVGFELRRVGSLLPTRKGQLPLDSPN